LKLIPVILCGGSGTRLWPLSRSHLPKQFLPLVTTNTMLQETLLRLKGLDDLDAPIAVANEEHRFLIAEQLRAIQCDAQALVLEPAGRNTAPALAAAALLARQSAGDATLLVLPSDHAIADLPRFHSAVRRAVALADTGKLVVFGIVPAGPHTGYGYIKRGAAAGAQAWDVERFVEKPDAAKARAFLAEGGYLWNSGMFVFRAARYLEELERTRPEIVRAMEKSIAGANRDMDFVRLEREAFLACPSDSIDYAVMEKTRDACVVEAQFSWNDVGAWSALWDLGAKDAEGNVVQGDVVVRKVRDSYFHSEGRLIAAVGVDNVVVIETADAVLVAAKAHAEDVKKMVEDLRLAQRPEYARHRRVYRPWGYYESIDSGGTFQVKRLMIKPGSRISLQLHHKRAEHWVVVSGTARITRDKDEFLLHPNQSTYIPVGTRHRLENAGSEPLYVIEVQSGEYLGEDDIERFADDYHRH
jgi:mannose-1-phosphate guanylyltransferase/mannose-6-phosphate isomerase